MSQLQTDETITNPAFQRLLQQCVHCGLCSAACPTYEVLHTEMDSPRGRISLMRAASEGRVSLNGSFAKHIDLCLACRSCETACPSGVRYGVLVGQTRIAVEKARQIKRTEKFVRDLTLRKLMPNHRRLKRLAGFVRLYQNSGLQRLVRKRKFLPEPLLTMESLLPDIPNNHEENHRSSQAVNTEAGTVAFFRGCVQDAFLAQVNAATLRVLKYNGYRVIVPPDQTCCGAAQFHVGEVDLSRQLARQNIDAFFRLEVEGHQVQAIINNAGGCGASLKEYADLLKDDPVYAEKAEVFVSKVRDISEFLAEHLTVQPKGEIHARVTYSDSCHLRHAQKVTLQPRALLHKIPGLEVVELQHPEFCCGSAGVYNIIHPDLANEILKKKIEDIAATQADTVVVTNTGCYLHILGGVHRGELQVQVKHLVELLDLSYRLGFNGHENS